MTMARTPEEIDPVWSEAFNAGDAEAVLSLYEPGAAFVLPTGETVEGSGRPGLERHSHFSPAVG